jgi:hypothetical protein
MVVEYWVLQQGSVRFWEPYAATAVYELALTITAGSSQDLHEVGYLVGIPPDSNGPELRGVNYILYML